MGIVYMTIINVKLGLLLKGAQVCFVSVYLHWSEMFCLPEDLNNDFAVSSFVSPMNSHFKTILWVELYKFKETCPGKP